MAEQTPSFGPTQPPAPPQTIKVKVNDGNRSVFIDMPVDYAQWPQEKQWAVARDLVDRLPKPLTERQQAAGDLGGLFGGIAGPLVAGMASTNPVTLALAALAASGLFGGGASYAAGASPTQAANMGMRQAIAGAPGELVAASKGLTSEFGRFLDKRALTNTLSDKTAGSIRIPGMRNPSEAEIKEFLYSEARKLPDIGVFGTEQAVKANQRALTNLGTQARAEAAAIPQKFDVDALLANAKQNATAQGHAFGNDPLMNNTFEATVNRAMDMGPLSGTRQVPTSTPVWNYPPGISPQAFQTHFAGLSPAVQQQLIKQGLGPIPTPNMKNVSFFPPASGSDLHTVKVQTWEDVVNRLARGADAGEPNLDTVQKSVAHEFADALSQASPAYAKVNQEFGIRAPLQDALQGAASASWRNPNWREMVTIPAAAGATLAGGAGYGAATAALGGGLSMLQRPAVESAVGLGLMKGANYLPHVGRGVVNPLSRFASFLLAERGDQQ